MTLESAAKLVNKESSRRLKIELQKQATIKEDNDKLLESLRNEWNRLIKEEIEKIKPPLPENI